MRKPEVENVANAVTVMSVETFKNVRKDLFPDVQIAGANE